MSDGPDLLERTRMALADCGIDPEVVCLRDGTQVRSALPRREVTEDLAYMMWRARSLALVGTVWQARCFACEAAGSPIEECLSAHVPLTEDCGVSR